MEAKRYRNKAFLSYRHVERDERLASFLQKKLERYRVPRGVEGVSSGRGVGRIFRDTTDLGARADLTAELRRELEDSEYLIVLCSKAAVGSKWIEREIRYFLRFHGTEKVLPVLADGEPEEVLSALLGGIEGMPQHPMACDFRGRKGQNIRRETARLASALLDCPYDELVDRRQRYETRRMAAAATGIFLFLFALTAYYAVMNARIRESFREQQAEESERLAIQSENALSQRMRLDAIRYALEALPSQEKDKKEEKPVSAKAMLALQKAVGAYVPEGSRTFAQTGEIVAPAGILEYSVLETGGSVYLAASCGKGDVLLWDAETGEKRYDSAVSETDHSDTDSQTATRNLLLAQDILVHSGKNALRGIDVRTGRVLWQVKEENVQLWEILDVRENVAAVLATGSSDTETEPYDFQELQLRTLTDGTLLCRRSIVRRPGPLQIKMVTDAYAPEKGGPALFLENTFFTQIPSESGLFLKDMPDFNPDSTETAAGAAGTAASAKETSASATAEKPAAMDTDAGAAGTAAGAGEDASVSTDIDTHFDCLYALDPETGKEQLLLKGQKIISFQRTAEGHVLAALYEGPDKYSEGSPYKSGDEFCFSGTGEESITLYCIEQETGKILWKRKSSCTQYTGVRLLPDLTADGQPVCVLTSGIRVEVFSQTHGKSLYAFDLPGLCASIRMDNYEGRDALCTILQDGAQAWYLFSSGEVLRKNAVFPGSIISAKEAGDRFFFLCSQDGNGVSNDRIYIFSNDVFDPDISYVLSSDGKKISVNPSLRYFSSEFAYGAQIETEDLFVLVDMDGNACGVDARTGKTRWEIPLGQNIDYAGFSKTTGKMIFRDYVLDGLTAAKRTLAGDPPPEETWKILHTEDGQIDTLNNIVKDAFPEKQMEIRKYTVGGDSLVIQATPKEQKPEETWLLRYSLTDKKTRTLCLKDWQQTFFPQGYALNRLTTSPDGQKTFCCFINDHNDWHSLMVDWDTGQLIPMEDAPRADLNSSIIWKQDGTRIAILTDDSGPALFSADGTPQPIPMDTDIVATRAGFREDKLFTIDLTNHELHFRIPQDGTDTLLPANNQLINTEADTIRRWTDTFSWELPDHKLLLLIGLQAFVFSPDTGDVEAFIDNVILYNPETDTLLLADDSFDTAIAPRYTWHDLAEKARAALP